MAYYTRLITAHGYMRKLSVKMKSCFLQCDYQNNFTWVTTIWDTFKVVRNSEMAVSAYCINQPRLNCMMAQKSNFSLSFLTLTRRKCYNKISDWVSSRQQFLLPKHTFEMERKSLLINVSTPYLLKQVIPVVYCAVRPWWKADLHQYISAQIPYLSVYKRKWSTFQWYLSQSTSSQQCALSTA